MAFFTGLFGQNGFMPHGHCYLWDPGLMRLHLISDFLIAAAYFTIPFTLVHFVRKRRDLPFNWMFVCFGIFIIACGMTHVMEIITLWKPYYWVSGIVKAITAFASVPTAILLIRLIPQVVNIPGPAVLRAANEALIEQTKLLNLIVTSMGDGLLVVDRDGAALLSNPALRRMLGLKEDEDVPKNCSQDCGFFHADKMKRIAPPESPTSRAVAGGHVDDEEIFIRHGSNVDGSWAVVTARALRDEHGTIHGAVAVFHDVTAHKRAEEQQRNLLREREARAEAEAANRAKDRFLAVLGHELRTPLTPVLAGVELLEQKINVNGEFKGTIEIIRRNIELEARLIDDILDLTAIAKGKINLDVGTVDIHATVRGALEIFKTEIAHKKLRVRTNLAAPEHFSQADDSRLMQVFWNVIKNAIKFTPDGGAIHIESTNEAGKVLVVRVSDNGIGIEPEVLPRIFDSFEQGVRRVQAGHGGLGLGLAISRAIVDAHHGQMEASSPGRNRGTVVTISLATIAVRSSTDEPKGKRDSIAASSTSEAQKTRPLRILLVDDHTDTVITLGALLRNLGYDVACAETVKQALQLSKESRFDLLVSDIGLPDGSGHDLMRQIRARQSIAGIALSGFGMEDDREKSRAVGFTDHLIKPVNVDRLQATLREIARSRATTT
jgi:PAS domain S-box-containing protein